MAGRSLILKERTCFLVVPSEMVGMAEVLLWQGASESPDLVHRAAAALAAGRLIAFPTETVYGVAANALAPEALARLGASKGRPEDKPWTVALRHPAEVLDWAPDLGPLGRRLARRCWPGPVTLVCGEGVERGRLGELPPAVRARLAPQGTVGLRVPAHAAVLHTLDRVSFPVVLTSANRGGEPPAVTAEEVVAAVGDDLDLVLDDGPCHFGQPSTVLRVEGNAWKVLREGVVTADEVTQLGLCVVVFVCTGNTCRSPMAEALCKQMLAERLGCPPEELPRRGFLVLSAGVAAMAGGGPATEAVAAAGEMGADLGGHVTQPLTADLADQADYLVAMTAGHLEALGEPDDALTPRPRLLAPDGADVADPIGSDGEVYRDCARQIREYLEPLVTELLEQGSEHTE